ncbi:apyrase [Chloropicon primus]|uniref:Apyrase n=1 Tax=Chloropicon primus TaxID=1764295 RepID=A0A5B8MI25_9CHLO|nr:apyrase [Chloropicon primus]UPQ99152.1 apyrase [Chloropicon primus]|eukprot:QDZ19941.1 apyrase [Chloropicon primus]
MRRVGARNKQTRSVNFMKGTTAGKKKSYIVVLIPCVVIFFIFLLAQRPEAQAGTPVTNFVQHREQQEGVLGKTRAEANAQGTESGLAGRGKYRCAVVIDAGSTGSRVHAFKFEASGEELTLLDSTFKAIEPGLSSFASEPVQAGKSLVPLLDKAKAFVPDDIMQETTVELRATAGLRMLEPSEVQSILQEVHTVLASYPFKVLDDAVSVMDGADEGVFMWVTSNYYLGNIGKPAEMTASVIDLGGGSVQRAFALAEGQPTPDTLADDSLRTITAGGQAYKVYVHSYLGFGLKAARMNFLKPFDAVDEGHPCMTRGYEGRYHYVDENVSVKADENDGADVDKCIATIEREMNFEEDCGVEGQCSFDGVWSGGSGGGSERNYVSSYIVDIARDVGVIPRQSTQQAVLLDEFRGAADKVCGLEYAAIQQSYGHYLNNDTDLPFICMDVLYAYVLLKRGFQINGDKEFTLVKQFDYKGKKVEAAWSLGAAINTLGKHSVAEVLGQE